MKDHTVLPKKLHVCSKDGFPFFLKQCLQQHMHTAGQAVEDGEGKKGSSN